MAEEVVVSAEAEADPRPALVLVLALPLPRPLVRDFTAFWKEELVSM